MRTCTKSLFPDCTLALACALVSDNPTQCPRFSPDCAIVRLQALRVGGQRAYDMARDGVDFKLEKRPVTVHQIRLLRPFAETAPAIHLSIECGEKMDLVVSEHMLETSRSSTCSEESSAFPESSLN